MAVSLQTFAHTAAQSSHVRLNDSGNLQSQSRVGAFFGRIASWLPGSSSAGIHQATKNNFKQALTQQFGAQIANRVMQRNGVNVHSSKPLRSRTIQKALRQAMVQQARQAPSSASLSTQASHARQAMQQAKNESNHAFAAYRQANNSLQKMMMAPSQHSPAAMQTARDKVAQARTAHSNACTRCSQATAHYVKLETTTGLLPQLFKDAQVAVPKSNQDISHFAADVRQARDTAIQQQLRESGLL